MAKESGAAFFACYLLTPALPPHRLRCTYEGFTVSPARRLRQHNGELAHGARRTARFRPWEMLVVLHGFPTKFHALQFEWAWQHPLVSRLTRDALAALKGMKGVGAPRSVQRKLRELHEMLRLPPWSQLPLTVSYTSDEAREMARSMLGVHYRCPAHMKCETRPLAKFASLLRRRPTRNAAANDDDEDDHDVDPDECFVCERPVQSSESTLRCYHRDCRLRCHASCLADHFVATAETSDTETRPAGGSCPRCTRELLWPLLTQQTRDQALGDRGAESAASESPTRKRKRQKDVRFAREQDAIQQHNAGRGPDGDAERDGSPEFDDSTWFEDDDFQMQSDSDEAQSPRVYKDIGGSTRVHRFYSTQGDVGGPTAPVVIDLTLDEDDDSH